MLTKRAVLASAAASLATAVGPGWATESKVTTEFPVIHTDAEWRKLLTPDQYAVLRESATELPFTSPLLHRSDTATSPVRAAISIFFPRPRNLTAGLGGQASRLRSRMRSAQPRTDPSAWCGSPCIAAAVVAISVISSMMDRSRQACVIA